MKILLFQRKALIKVLFILLLFISIIAFICKSMIFADEKEKVLSEEKISKIETIYDKPEKIAYLTFDDGPTKNVTPKVLEILKKNNTLANFFVVGKHVAEYPELVKQEYEDGHFIANHGYSHNNNKLYKSKNDFINEILKTDEAISTAIGVSGYHSHIFRFPNGSMSKNHYNAKKNATNYLKEIDYTYVDWNALNNDSIKKYSKEQLLSNLKKSSKDKGTLVILMHDTGDVNNTYDVLEDSINYIKSQGYEFRTFYDILN